MNIKFHQVKLLFTLPLLSLLIAACQGCSDDDAAKKTAANPTAEKAAVVTTSAAASSAAPIAFPCLNQPSISYQTPGDTPITSQDGLNCFAWQTFVGLNWAVDASNPGEPDKSVPASAFGNPGVVVWETYANSKNIFRPKGEAPLPWGHSAEVPSSCQSKAQSLGVRVMRASRIPGDFNMSKDASQAFPGNNPNWLADKNGNLVYYEILVGKDEYDYINSNTLYSADGQASHIQHKQNIAMPMGHDELLGGLELKAAWLHVSDPSNPKWKKYKLSKAVIYDPLSNDCSENTLALVGLHIIHKTASQPQWVWATFEHVDNAPDTASIQSDGTVAGDFTFYNNQCSVMPVPKGCTAKTVNGVAVTETSCAPNVSPAYKADDSGNCPAYPIRVSRDFPIRDTTDNHIATLNKAMQQLIASTNGASVYANYQLVNVLWSSAAVNDNEPPGNPPLTPLSVSGETPSLNAVPVANTMLETYAQGFNCLSCHAFASVSKQAKVQLGNKAYASDYSFIFSFAQSPTAK